MKIIISGPARAFDRESEEMITDSGRLSQLDGLRYAEDSCGGYLSKALYEIGVVGGQIELAYRASDSALRVLTTYHAPRKLNQAELQMLVGETTGQWSDGIGEGEFQHAEKFGLDIDISPLDSNATIEQIDDGIVVKARERNELLELLQERHVDEEAALTLVNGGADIHAKDRYGQSVLELACSAVLPNLVELLVKRGALDIAGDGNRALSVLSFCSGSDERQNKCVQIAELLVENGVDFDAFDKDGRTPLMMAANRNNLPLVKFLLSKGANVNALDRDEYNRHSVLMYAQRLEMVRYLLENRANPAIRNASGEDAYDYRLKNSHQQDFKAAAELIKHYLK